MLANKYLKTSQLCMLFLAIVTVTKLVSMPSFLTMGADRSLWISAMICFSLDLILFSITSLACKRYNCTFFEALKNTFGNKTAKVIMAIFALFFFIKALYPLLEEKYFIENTFYEEITTSFIFYPFFGLLFYLCFKGIKCLERTSFLLCFFAVCGTVLTFFLTYKESRLVRLLPLFQQSPKAIITTSINNLSFCGEGIYLLFFMGRTEPNKNLTFPLILTLLVGYIAVIGLMVNFYGIFGSVSMSKIFSLSQMSHYSLIISNIGRLDSLACFLIDFVRLFAISLPLMLCVECTRYIFGEKIKPTLIASAVFVLLSIIFVSTFNEKVFYTFSLFNRWFKYFLLPFNFILPFFVFTLKKEKK